MIIASAQQYTVATILSSMMYFKGELSDDNEHGMSFNPLPLPSLHLVSMAEFLRLHLEDPRCPVGRCHGFQHIVFSARLRRRDLQARAQQCNRGALD